MRVICCYSSRIHPKAEKALEKYAPQAELVHTPGLYGYNEAIAERWTGTDDLVVIEQDKEITAEVLPSFAACGLFWCSYSYKVFPRPYSREVTIGLGCTRFASTIQKIISPNEFLGPDPQMLATCPDCNGKGCWRYLDSRIAFAVMNARLAVHVHGHIEHHHEYPPDWAEYRTKLIRTSL